MPAGKLRPAATVAYLAAGDKHCEQAAQRTRIGCEVIVSILASPTRLHRPITPPEGGARVGLVFHFFV